ncbi:MAG: MBL fold metallo-hydrolase [Planctomycetota bacterium]|jgi:glyoxylase-like metal-dependent hydrolase (beta-lactamase superfamily II)
MPRDPRRVKVVPVSHDKGCRSYVVVDPESRDACVIDPLLDRMGETLRVLGEEGAHLRWIVDTHSHGDHLSGAAALKERSEATVVMHAAANSQVATLNPQDGERLAFGEHGLKIHHAPGNTPDALVVEAPGAVFTGDTLLIGTVGLRDVPGADADAWFASLQRIFEDLPETTVIHPGHDDMGRSMTTLRQERTGNGWLRQDDLEAFRSTFAADDRQVRKDAPSLLESNRTGLTRVPRHVEAASGLTTPFDATQSALRREPTWEPEDKAVRPPLSGPHRALLLLAGGVAVGATFLGWWLGPLFHALAGLSGIVLLGVGLQAGTPRRRRKGGTEGGLFYEGPTRHTITG